MLEVTPVSAFRDNYIWVLERDGLAVVVDPGDAAPVQAFLAQRGLKLAAILATHHHADHVGGIAQLLSAGAVPVFGPRNESVATVTHPLGEGDTAVVEAMDLRFDVLDIPGHTKGHIAFFGHCMLFCGDTLFACGCGRLFEGTAEQMSASLAKLAALGPDTAVYCGHEYTLANLRFAEAVEPENAAVRARIARERAKREQDLPTLPSTIGDELATNPFLRAALPNVMARASIHAGRPMNGSVETFATLRTWKNGFQ